MVPRYALGGQSHAACADRTGLRLAAVKRRAFQARRRLAAFLQQ